MLRPRENRELRLMSHILTITLGSMLGRERHVGEHLGLGLIQEVSELGQLGTEPSATFRHCARAALASSGQTRGNKGGDERAARSFRHAPARCA
jgi:hypothetical protein